MNLDDPEVRRFIRQAMVARIATLSRNGRPSITPLYFVYVNGHIWLGTADWTLAAREVKANSRVSVLLEIERNPTSRRTLRVTGSASVETDANTLRTSDLRTVFKYILPPGALLNRLAHRHLRRALSGYHAQSAGKGQRCIIDVTPEQVEFLSDSP